MHVVSFVSGTGGNLRATLKVQDEYPDLIKVGLVISDRPEIPALAIATDRSIPVLAGRFEEECGVWSKCRGDEEAESRYKLAAMRFHRNALDFIRAHENHSRWKFDLAVLSYRRWIHGDLLEYFRDRMINQHAADLTQLDERHQRKYVGVNPVLGALASGETRTRTSTIMVGEGHDAGEILCQGPWVPYIGPLVTRESALAHEELQKRASDWPSLAFALLGIAEGRFALSDRMHEDGSRLVLLDGVPLPFGGVDLNISS